MKTTLVLLTILFTHLVFAQSDCSNDKSLGDKIASKIEYKCSKRMKEAISYKESNKEIAMNTLKVLCNDSSKITPDCIIFGKDASVSNTVISQVCPKAKEETIRCLLTAISVKKSDSDIIKSCGKK